MSGPKLGLFAILCVLALVYLVGSTYRDVTRADDPGEFFPTLVCLLLALGAAWVVLS